MGEEKVSAPSTAPVEALPDASLDSSDALDAQDRRDRAVRHDALAAYLRAHWKSAPASRTVPEMYDAVKLVVNEMRAADKKELAHTFGAMMDLVAERVKVDQTTTDDDGRYEIHQLPPGDYFLFAHWESATRQIDWLLPIHIAGEGLTVDLSSDNATATHSGN
jgi:hypothetical protein